MAAEALKAIPKKALKEIHRTGNIYLVYLGHNSIN
jgi:hypothetical protein